MFEWYEILLKTEKLRINWIFSCVIRLKAEKFSNNGFNNLIGLYYIFDIEYFEIQNMVVMNLDEIDNEVYIVGELFRELFKKISLIENKKHLYKDFKELTLIEIDTILVIGCEEKKSMSEIAKMLGVSFGTPTVTIDRLISKGFVERTRDDADRRQVFIELSPKGKEVYNSVVELKNKATRIIFGILTKEEREGTIAVLSKLNNMFSEMTSNI